MTRKLILSSPLLEITISRLCQELIENQIKDVETVILGLSLVVFSLRNASQKN